MNLCPPSVSGDLPFEMIVPQHLVARVDAALRREGLDVVQTSARSVTLVESALTHDVPRAISWDGPEVTPWGWV